MSADGKNINVSDSSGVFDAYPTTDEIERLITRNKLLEAVATAAKKIKWQSAERDNMEYKTTCWRKEELQQALAALKGE